MDGFDVTLLGALGAGLVSFLSPCVLPLVPPYLCYLGGVSFEQLSDERSDNRAVRIRILVASVAFVLGFSTVFVALGATATWLGQVVGDYLEVLSKVAGVIIIILGIHFAGLFRISTLFRDVRFTVADKPAGILGAYIVGLAFAFGWTPCVGPVLATILFMAGGEESVGKGAGLLAVYSLGIGLPFMGAALAIGPFLNFMRRFRAHLGTIEKVMGYLLIGTGLLFVFGGFNNLGYWLLEMFPSLGRVG